MPRRYPDPGDAEVAGLLAASLAYGRADLFKPRLAKVLAAMGPSPAAFAEAFAAAPDPGAFDGFRYRFNRPEDVAALVAAAGFLRRRHGSLGAFLAAVILVGQLLAVFMANSGAAWDNAKKKIEDGYYGGKGSQAHKASVIGDTVGDPLKDSAGPAINPLIKVMNLVTLLFAPVIMAFRKNPMVAGVVALVLIAILGVAIAYSKRETDIYSSE